MATQQLLVRIPEELARRLKRQVPARGRSAFVQRLLEQALAPEGSEDDSLYLAAGATRVSQPVAPAAAVRRGDVPESRRDMGLY